MTADITNDSSEHDNDRDGSGPPLRIGVLRAADASADPTVAEMEARVLRAELERRIGAVTLDLRTDGPATGPWLPRAHAAWPADIDVTIELDSDQARHLLVLFGRTIEPVAADVRSRMLHHLGVLPVGDAPLTDELLAELLPVHARPTDLWLVVQSAAQLATSEPAHRLLRSDAADSGPADVDRWFDSTAADLPTDTTATINRLQAEVAELRSRLDAAGDDLARTERAALERIEDLTAERDSLGERLGRAELDHATGSSS